MMDRPDEVPAAPVFVDAGPFSYARLTGLSRYTARLALALSRRVPVRYFSEGEELMPPFGMSHDLDQDLARWSRRVWRSPRRPLELAPAGSLGLYCTLRPETRWFPVEASVLHDFSPYTVPHTHLESTRAMFGDFFARTLLQSDVAIAVSESTKADAAWLSPMDPDRIVVAPSGPSLCVHRHQFTSQVKRRAEVGLAVSTLEPRKNARFLFDWFRETKTLPDQAELWWVGPVGWLSSRREFGKLQVGGRRIRFLGVVSDESLCRLYQTAGWTAYPSLYEGFGFPVLDALRHGAPTLAAANSSIREFQSPGLHFFDPTDPATLDTAYRELDAHRGEPIPVGPLDAEYDWGRVAQAVLVQRDRIQRGARPSADPLAA